MNAPHSTKSRVVIYRLGSLGDTVVALPCFHKVAEVFEASERTVLTNFPISSKAAPLEAILRGSGLVHHFMAYPVGTRSVRKLLVLGIALRALKADTLVYLTPSRGLPTAWRDLLFFRLCGFKRIVGLPLSRDLQENRRRGTGLVEWECARLARCIAALGCIQLENTAVWSLHLTAAEHEAGTNALGDVAHWPRIAINMGGKVVENDWGEPNWLALISRLRACCGDHALVFIGAAEDSPRAARVAARWEGKSINLCGQVPPRVSAAAMAGSRFFIGHDSGPLHLAACVGVNCIGLYGNKNEPRKWHPYGNGHRIIHDGRGVHAIEVNQVVHAVESQLAASSVSTDAALHGSNAETRS